MQMAAPAGPAADATLYRKLRPGPGRSATEVLANQRARLLGAMVELVAERGLPEVTVRGLSRSAGVSTRAFYECFANVEECFLAAYTQVVRSMLKRVFEIDGGEEAQMRALAREFFVGFSENPKAAHLVLLEPLDAGPLVAERTRCAMVCFERLFAAGLGSRLGSTPAGAAVSHGIVGAALHLARSRLLVGRPDECPGLMEDFVDWLGAMEEEPLTRVLQMKMSTATDWGATDDALATRPTAVVDDRGFLLAAVVNLTLRGGYASLSVPGIRREAGLSRRSFDENFGSVAACFLAAIEARVSEALDRADQEASGTKSWEERVVRVIASVCRQLARDPGLARLALIEIIAPGRIGLERRELIGNRLSERLVATASSAASTSLAAEASVAAIWTMAARKAATGRVEQILELAPVMSFFALAPMVGASAAERATAVALR